MQSSFVGMQYKYKLSSHPRRHTNEYRVKETEVDQSCFNEKCKMGQGPTPLRTARISGLKS